MLKNKAGQENLAIWSTRVATGDNSTLQGTTPEIFSNPTKVMWSIRWT